MKTSAFLPTNSSTSRSYRGVMLDWGKIAGAQDAGGNSAIIGWDWSWRAVLGARGADARDWLHGMLTANVRALAPGATAPALVLNPRGHILGTVRVVALTPDAFLLLTDESQRLSLYAHLRRFIIREKVEFRDYGATDVEAIGIIGGEAGAGLQAAGLPTPALGGVESVRAEAAWGLHYRWGQGEVWELVCTDGGLREWRQKLEAGGMRWQAGAEQERRRIDWGVPLYGQDIRERDLPQETRQMEALDFHKGCYIGQEIVERIRARGQVHRGLFRLRFPRPVMAGAGLTKNGEAAGEITSAAALETGEGAALGYVRQAQPGDRVQAGELEGVLLE